MSAAAAKKKPTRTVPPIAKPDLPSMPVQRSGAKVSVACKVPNGLVLRLFDWNEEDVPLFGGGFKRARVARFNGTQVVLHGPATPFGQQAKTLIVGGYAINPNIDADLWAAWLRQNKDSDVVTEKQVYAMETAEDTAAWAREHAAVRSGLEPINPGTVRDAKGKEIPADMRMPRGGANLTGITTDPGSSA